MRGGVMSFMSKCAHPGCVALLETTVLQTTWLCGDHSKPMTTDTDKPDTSTKAVENACGSAEQIVTLLDQVDTGSVGELAREMIKLLVERIRPLAAERDELKSKVDRWIDINSDNIKSAQLMAKEARQANKRAEAAEAQVKELEKE